MASTKSLSLLLILSLFTLTSAAFIDPGLMNNAVNSALHQESCTANSDPKKCTQSIPNAALAGKLTKETLTNPNTIYLAQESVHAAKQAGVNVLYYMSSVLGDPINRPAMIKCINTCNVTIEAAVKELDNSVKMMYGKTMVTAVELQTIEKSVNSATESAVKCNVSCKQSKADMQVMFENLLDQYIKMSKIAIKVTSMMADAAN